MSDRQDVVKIPWTYWLSNVANQAKSVHSDVEVSLSVLQLAYIAALLDTLEYKHTE